jgi:predicted RNase H-like nuclease (RuvC/YqgF family)
MTDDLERKVDEHSIQIQELHDEIDFKKWKIDSLIEKIDNLTTVVQQIQLNQLRDDSDIKNRITSIESTMTTLKWVVGVGLTLLGVVVAYISLMITILH